MYKVDEIKKLIEDGQDDQAMVRLKFNENYRMLTQGDSTVPVIPAQQTLLIEISAIVPPSTCLGATPADIIDSRYHAILKVVGYGQGVYNFNLGQYIQIQQDTPIMALRRLSFNNLSIDDHKRELEDIANNNKTQPHIISTFPSRLVKEYALIDPYKVLYIIKDPTEQLAKFDEELSKLTDSGLILS